MVYAYISTGGGVGAWLLLSGSNVEDWMIMMMMMIMMTNALHYPSSPPSQLFTTTTITLSYIHRDAWSLTTLPFSSVKYSKHGFNLIPVVVVVVLVVVGLMMMMMVIMEEEEEEEENKEKENHYHLVVGLSLTMPLR